MVNQIVIDDAFKADLQKALVNDLISALQDEKLNFKQMRISANFILDHLETIQDKESLTSFLEELHSQWPSFDSSYKIFTSKVSGSEDKEKEVMDKLSSYIKSFEN